MKTISACPGCNMRLRVRGDQTAFKCPKCGKTIQLEDDAAPEDDEEERKRRKRKRRAAGLSSVRKGLGWHMFVPVAAHAGVTFAFGALAIILFFFWFSLIGQALLSGRGARARQIDPFGFPTSFFIPSVALLALVVIADLPACLRCLRASRMRTMILISLLLRAVAIAAGVAFLFTADALAKVFLALFFIAYLGSWPFWLSALQRLADQLKSGMLMRWVQEMSFRYPFTLLGSALGVFFLTSFASFILLGLGFLEIQKWGFAIGCFILGGGCTFALFKIVAISKDYSLVEALMTPTEISWTLQYINLLRGIREEITETVHVPRDAD